MKRYVLCAVFSLFLINALFFKINEAYGDGTGNIKGYATSFGNKGAINTLIFIEDLTGDFEPPEEHAMINQINTEFVPRMLPVLKGTVVDFVNSDAGWHNVYSPEQSVTPFNLGTYPPGRTRSMKFENIGVAPISCEMHSEMRTYVIALGNPFFAVTDAVGKYTINDVPAGEYTLRAWHEKWSSDKQKISIEEGKTLAIDFELR